MKKPFVILIVVFAIAAMCSGCASYITRTDMGQSFWSYDDGPYPGTRLYISNFATDEEIPPSTPHCGYLDGISRTQACLMIVGALPLWLGDVILSTVFDTVLLPYDTIKVIVKKDEDNPTTDSTLSTEGAPSVEK